MTYDLYIGDRTFSSWSLRGWLMVEKFNLPYRTHAIGVYSGTMAQEMADLAPARLVPVLKRPGGTLVGESLAIAETLAEENPQAQMWPTDSGARATARWLCAAMVGGFSALRNACPMQLQHVNTGFQPSDAVQADLARIEELWAHAARFKSEGDWLFGAYSLADVFYAPVCARVVGYDLPVSDATLAYCMQTLRDPSFRTWRSEGQKISYDPFPYDMGLPTRAWPT
jgi:glutathione S-transferase